MFLAISNSWFNFRKNFWPAGVTDRLVTIESSRPKILLYPLRNKLCFQRLFLHLIRGKFMHIASNRIESTYPMILCVDDEPAIVDSLERQLHWYKVRVTKALHGMQGVWLSQVAKPDLIITDLKMPLYDGRELLDVVNHVPIIFLTGIRDVETRTNLMDAGAAAVLHKPMDCRQLIEKVGEYIHLERRRWRA